MIAKKESSYKNSNLKNKREQRNGARDVGSFKKVNMESSAVMEYLCISRLPTGKTRRS